MWVEEKLWGWATVGIRHAACNPCAGMLTPAISRFLV